MPLQVPGLVPDVAPQGFAPEVSVPAPVEAFGGAVGHALSGLGDQVERSSDQLWARAVDLQNLQNETDAKNADAEYMQKSGILHANFINKEGVNAGPDALKAHIKELQDLRTQIRGNLSNPMAQKMYDSSSLQFMGRNIFNAAGHSGQQIKVAANGASRARVDELTDQIGANPQDEEMFQRNTYAVHHEIADMGARMGWSEDQIKDTTAQEISSAVAKRAVGLGRLGKLDDAQKLYDQATKQGVLLPNDAAKIDQIIKTQSRVIGSANTAAEIYNDGLDETGEQKKSLKQLQDEGRARAEKDHPGDAIYASHLVTAIDQRYSQNIRAENSARWQNEDTVRTAVLALGQDATMQKVLADPATAQAYYALPAKKQQQLKLEVDAKENSGNYYRLMGMSKSTDDDVRSKFMDTDPLSVQMSPAQRNAIMDRRAAILKGKDADPHLWQVMSQLRGNMGGQLQSLGIFHRSANDEFSQSNFDMFTGVVDTALKAWQDQHGKAPTSDEVQTKIMPQIIQQYTAEHWFSGPTQESKFVDIPEKFVTDVKKYATDHNQPPPTDTQVRRAFVRKQLYELYAPQSFKDKLERGGGGG